MLLGEGSVFLIILFGGVFMIRKAFKREKQLNKLQENFLQSVSHELKTPIASVDLYLQTLKKHDLDPEKRADIYQRSLFEIERLNMLISDMLLARNIESANYYFNPEQVNLKDHIQQLIERTKSSILKEHEININLVEASTTIDKSAFDSVFFNLVENAVKYSPKGSKISFRLEKSEHLKFSISDEGSGIPNELKAEVFKKFFRIENETTRKSKGTGLGLHIAHFLITQQGGTIKLLDNRPRGLTVEIQFK
jgi:K+-sensing histidine kinase KdpD